MARAHAAVMLVRAPPGPQQTPAVAAAEAAPGSTAAAHAAWAAATAAVLAAYRVRSTAGQEMAEEAAAAAAAAAAALFAAAAETGSDGGGEAIPAPPPMQGQGELSVLVRVCAAVPARGHNGSADGEAKDSECDSDGDSDDERAGERLLVRVGVPADATVAELKQRLAPTTRIAAGDQRLVLCGRLLADGETVGAAGGAGFLGQSGERVVLLWPSATPGPQEGTAGPAASSAAGAAAARAGAGAAEAAEEDGARGWTVVAPRRRGRAACRRGGRAGR